MEISFLFLIQVDFAHLWTMKYPDHIVNPAVNLKHFWPDSEWKVVESKAQKYYRYYPCCSAYYPDLKFNITFEKQKLFYTVSLVLVPCVTNSIVACLVFYLPADSGEKVSLSLTAFLSTSIYQMLLMESNPIENMTLPHVLIYMLFTTVMISLSFAMTIVVLNTIHTKSTQRPPRVVLRVLLHILPTFLCIDVIKQNHDDDQQLSNNHDDDQQHQYDEATMTPAAKVSDVNMNV